MEDWDRAARFEEVQRRRQGWFDRIYRRFDLVGFEEVARWRAGVNNGPPQDETLQNLLDAIQHGEFGMGPKIGIVYMPHQTARWTPGAFPLRTYVGQVLHIVKNNVDDLRDLYAPAASVKRWFQAREFKLPPWLAVPSAGSDLTPANAAVAAAARSAQRAIGGGAAQPVTGITNTASGFAESSATVNGEAKAQCRFSKAEKEVEFPRWRKEFAQWRASLRVRGRREGRMLAGTRGPRANKKMHGAGTTGSAEAYPAFPAQWF
jgi:hypothetical protein